LGTSFIKLGQMLSTRADLLPPEYQAELAKLQDQAPPVPRTLIEETLVADLGCSVEEAFATFDFEPLASGSIGQVHAATLHTGAEVIVKVRRPGALEQVEEDLEILEYLAKTASQHWEMAHHYDLPGLVHEFGQALRAELDFLQEASNAERFAANFKATPSIHIPYVYWQATTARVLTLERIRGIKISDLGALDAAGIDRSALAERAARMMLQMVLEDGFFHADPHPGNFFIEPAGRIGLIDFGMVGFVDARTQDHLIDLFLALSSQDSERLVDVLLLLGCTQRRVDRRALSRDLHQWLAQYLGRPLGEIPLGPLLTQALTIIRRHHLQLPANLALLLKMLLMDESLGCMLDPTFKLTGLLASFSQRLLLRRYAPGNWIPQISRAGIDAARLGIELPQQLRRLLNELERTHMEVGLRPEPLQPLVQRFEQMTNRLVLAIIVAALINGMAVLLLVSHPFIGGEWLGWFFILGCILVSTLGIALAWSMLRSRYK
jgi:ubiquinone biosynthesis protein